MSAEQPVRSIVVSIALLLGSLLAGPAGAQRLDLSAPRLGPSPGDWAREVALQRALRQKAMAVAAEREDAAHEREIELYLERERSCNERRLESIRAQQPLEAAHAAYLDCLSER
jgi:hypothetical protein